MLLLSCFKGYHQSNLLNCSTNKHLGCPCLRPAYYNIATAFTDCMIAQEHIYNHVSLVHWVTVAANQEGWECVHHPLGLIYCPMLGCYCTDLLLRPGVNCPALGSISNRTARDMGPDTSKRWHYIIPRCFSKWSTQTPPYKSLGEGSQNLRPELPGNVISFRAHWERSSSSIMTSTFPPLLLLEDQWMCGVSVAIFYLNNYSII